MNEGLATYFDCPAYMSNADTVRCGLPAEVECRYTIESSDGPLESAKIRCPRGHWFNGPIEFLTVPRPQTAISRINLPAATADPRATRA